MILEKVLYAPVLNNYHPNRAIEALLHWILYAMSLSNEAIIAIVALGLALVPLLIKLWRSHKARRQAMAARRASADTEMQHLTAHLREPAVLSPSCSSLHRYVEYKLHEQIKYFP
ncbi:hypothetical protein LMH87_005674 [Akanthomyces muscarius]|uniref:Uncharacterized protein n=1 Tax=Akanthomyces muscarius TaxID=2231603 RepID=A0A9W8QL79_AKAMU|nr:hypothetical protein LMH87_005674 [Akanthomyces muscarius]KAJ4163981.1 hypothetical protein LMH87_005674 [Akanthomyces muscarius]